MTRALALLAAVLATGCASTPTPAPDVRIERTTLGVLEACVEGEATCRELDRPAQLAEIRRLLQVYDVHCPAPMDFEGR